MNTIGSAGARTLASALERNKGLLLFDVSSNEITDTGVKFLARAIGASASLVKVKLTDNQLRTIEPTRALIDALKRNPQLIDVTWDVVDKALCRERETALQFNRTCSDARARVLTLHTSQGNIASLQNRLVSFFPPKRFPALRFRYVAHRRDTSTHSQPNTSVTERAASPQLLGEQDQSPSPGLVAALQRRIGAQEDTIAELRRQLSSLRAEYVRKIAELERHQQLISEMQVAAMHVQDHAARLTSLASRRQLDP